MTGGLTLTMGVPAEAETIVAQPKASWLYRLAWLPIPVFAIAIGVLSVVHFEAVWNPPLLIPVLNVLFGAVTFFVPVLAARSYLQCRSMSVLVMGCGTLALGLGGLAGQFFILGHEMNSNIAIISVMGCLAGICHISVAVSGLFSGPQRMRSGLPLVVALFLAILVMFSGFFLLIQYHVWPDHYLEGVGVTPFGKAFLWGTAGLFAISACLMVANRVKDESGFRWWYGLGIGLLALDYFGVSMQAATGDPLNWVSRFSAYLCAAYVLIAIISTFRQSGEWVLPLDRSLRETEALYQSLVEVSPDAILVYVGERCAFANPAAVRLFYARSAEDLVGRNISDLLPAEYHPYIGQHIANVQRSMAMALVEARVVRLDGQEIQVEVTGAKVEYGGRPAIQYFVRDITGQKEAENELIEAKAQAELYLDLMGHDISNMHQIILGQLELVREQQGDFGKRLADDRGLIDTSIETLHRSARLIENVRNVQKLKAGDIQLQRTDLGAVLSESVAVFSSQTGRDITIRYDLVGDCYVRANPLIKDVFGNLLDNSVKHCDDPVKIDLSVSLRKSDRQNFYEVTLEDNGRGIPDERKSEIFLRLKRGETKARGTGLGLYIVKTLVESFGGSVEVGDRVPGDHKKGAKFVVSLPVYEMP